MFRSRAAIAFNLIIIKKKINAEHPNAHASIIDFCKNVNIHFYAIFFFNIFLLFTIRKKRKDENKNYYNNNNDENNEKENDDNKNK